MLRVHTMFSALRELRSLTLTNYATLAIQSFFDCNIAYLTQTMLPKNVICFSFFSRKKYVMCLKYKVFIQVDIISCCNISIYFRNSVASMVSIWVYNFNHLYIRKYHKCLDFQYFPSLYFSGNFIENICLKSNKLNDQFTD